jgi:outer membrane protein assembly factor BamB
MRGLLSPALFCLSTLALGGIVAQAQDWRTAGFDAQRSQWMRSNGKIAPDTVKSPDFELLWKVQVKNEPRQMSAMTPPILLERIVGYRGFRALGFFGTSDGHIYAVDTDLARMEWERRIDSGPISSDATIACPGGLTSTLARPTRYEFPPPSFGGSGRRTPATSAVGQPKAGAVTLQPQERPAPRSAEEPTSARVGRPLGNPNSGLSLVYAVTSDGMFHSFHTSNGATQVAPIPFLPPGAHARGLIVIDDTAYVGTVNNCGGVPDGVWSLNLETKAVTHWPPTDRQESLNGLSGFAMGSDGRIYVDASNSAIAVLEPETLETDYRWALPTPGGSLSSAPVIIDYDDDDHTVVGASDGTIKVVPPSGSSKQVFAAKGSSPASALATWKDDAGTIWILASTETSVDAYKIVESNGAPALERGWTKAIDAPLPPMIVNGVVFVAASGEFRDSDNAAERVRRSTHATLYALNGETGAELWDSGDAIKSFSAGAGLSAGNLNVYVSTYDGTLYAFGFPMEH